MSGIVEQIEDTIDRVMTNLNIDRTQVRYSDVYWVDIVYSGSYPDVMRLQREFVNISRDPWIVPTFINAKEYRN